MAVPTVPATPDDLLIIEGIGPKINQALITAGITTFPALVAASEDQLKAAISAAGMSFAPSLPTWGKQAAFLTRGDRAGFDAYVEHLVAGRDPSA